MRTAVAEARRTAPAVRGRRVPSTAAAAAPDDVSGIVRLGFLAFAASIPFEWPARTIPIDFPALGLLVFLLTTLAQPVVCYGRLPRAVWFFVAYFWVFLFSFARGDGAFQSDVTRQVLTLVQLLLLFVAGSNLLQRDRIARDVLLTLAAACMALALLQLSGAVSPEVNEYAGELQRMHALDQNSNRAGRIFGTAVMALIGLNYGVRTPAIRRRWLVWPGVGLCIAGILQGGSRGSLLVLLVGLWLFTLGGANVRQVLRNTALIAVGVVILIVVALQSPLVRARWEKAQSGDMSGREEIFPAAWSMVRDRPLTGWGPTANKYELAARVPQQGYARRDTHNLGLELLTSTGLLGFIPFMGALLVCLHASWRARPGPHGILPFVLTASLLAGNMAANYLTFKLQWLVLAYAVARGAPFVAAAARHAAGTRDAYRFARPVVSGVRAQL